MARSLGRMAVRHCVRCWQNIRSSIAALFSMCRYPHEGSREVYGKPRRSERHMNDDGWTDLAEALKVSVRNLHRWKRDPTTPQEPDIEAWKAWMVANGKGITRKDWATNYVRPDGLELPGTCSYDAAMGKQYPALEAIRREQIREQELKNELLRIEVEQTKKEMFSKEDVEERDDLLNQAIVVEAEKVQRLIDGIDGVTPDIRKVFAERFKSWRTEMAKALGKVNK
jgi:hypothetical protein